LLNFNTKTTEPSSGKLIEIGSLLRKTIVSMHCVLQYINEKLFHQKLTTDILCNVTVMSFPVLIDTTKDLSIMMLLTRSCLWPSWS